MAATIDFKLRPFVPQDAESFAKYADNMLIARNMRNVFPHPYVHQDAVNLITSLHGQNPVKVFAIDINGEACGAIGIFPQEDIHEKCAELGYWLGQPFWGNGIATEAVKQMIEYGFKTFDIIRIYGIVFSRNPASARVLEKAGMAFEARLSKSIYKFGEVMDELVYAVLKK